jgi:argininosuccinate lyase
MQEDKEPLFDAVDTLEVCLEAANRMLLGLRFNRERLAEASSDEMLAATDLADALVAAGVPFREAHGTVAGLVRTAVDSGRKLSELGDTEMNGVPDSARRKLQESLGENGVLESKVSAGGTSSGRIAEQLDAARRSLDALSR